MPSDNVKIEIKPKDLGAEFENTPFENIDSDNVYGQKTQAVPAPGTNIGIDVDKQFFEDILEANKAGDLDMSAIQSFTQLAQTRDQLYTLLDNMAEDSVIAAVLRDYAGDATEMNEDGKIMWVESSDANCAKMVSFLLDTMNVDKHLYSWVSKLCKYGDVYFRLYRKSELEDPLFKTVEQSSDEFDNFVEKELDPKRKKSLNEDVVFKTYSANDHYSHYIEMVPNPAENFELVRHGKTYGFIKADVNTSVFTNDNPTLLSQIRYSFKRNDVVVSEATEYVHACLDDGTSRVPETVDIFLTDDTSANAPQVSYNVRRGKSILYDAYQAWRLLSLLENSVLLNRLTKSQLIRLITIDVGGMPREDAVPIMRSLKQQLEQKAAINVSKYLEEYTNPGPIENNVYWTTRNGLGNINIQNIGGEYDPKSLIDLEYYRDKMFGALSVPKQFYGFTEDGAGFNGGTSLSILSAQYAKKIKHIQNAIIQAITDAINLMLIDKQLDDYVNKFQLRMTPPITQDELDRRENLSNKIAVVQDTWNLLDDIEDPVIALKIKKALLSKTLTDAEVIDLLQEQIDKTESQEEDGGVSETNVENEAPEEETEISSTTSEPTSLADAIGANTEGEIEVAEEEPAAETILPSGEDLGLDFTDNNNPEFS